MSTVATSPERLRDDLVRLMHRGAGVRDFALGVARILARSVPFEGVCVGTMDPAYAVAPTLRGRPVGPGRRLERRPPLAGRCRVSSGRGAAFAATALAVTAAPEGVA